MNDQVKKQWIKALLSGEYVQGQNRLCQAGERYDYFCCLGVLTDLYIREHDDVEWSLYDKIYYSKSKTEEESLYLPKEVEQWADIDQTEQQKLMVLNDSGYSFEKIAKEI